MKGMDYVEDCLDLVPAWAPSDEAVVSEWLLAREYEDWWAELDG